MSFEIYVTGWVEANKTRMNEIASDLVAAYRSVSAFPLGSEYLCVSADRLKSHMGRWSGLHAANADLAIEIARAYLVHQDRDSDDNPLVQTLQGDWVYYMRGSQ